MMKQSEHPTLIRLLNNVVSEIPVTKRGTYNRQDPTAYEKGEKEFSYKGKDFVLTFSDCTWGIELEIFKGYYYPNSKKIWYRDYIAGFYISRESKYDKKTNRRVSYDLIIYRQKDSKGTLKLLAKAFPQCLSFTYLSSEQLAWNWCERQSWLQKEEDNEMWIDPAGGVHYGNEEDPARMYE